MGLIRKLVPHERQARIDQIPKSEIEHHQTAEGKKFLQENGYTLETWNSMVTQQRYEGEVYITIKQLRALQKDDLINYIEQVLEHGLLKPTAIEEEDWELHWSEKMLFKNLPYINLTLAISVLFFVISGVQYWVTFYMIAVLGVPEK